MVVMDKKEVEEEVVAEKEIVEETEGGGGGGGGFVAPFVLNNARKVKTRRLLFYCFFELYQNLNSTQKHEFMQQEIILHPVTRNLDQVNAFYNIFTEDFRLNIHKVQCHNCPIAFVWYTPSGRFCFISHIIFPFSIVSRYFDWVL